MDRLKGVIRTHVVKEWVQATPAEYALVMDSPPVVCRTAGMLEQ